MKRYLTHGLAVLLGAGLALAARGLTGDPQYAEQSRASSDVDPARIKVALAEAEEREEVLRAEIRRLTGFLDASSAPSSPSPTEVAAADRRKVMEQLRDTTSRLRLDKQVLRTKVGWLKRDLAWARGVERDYILKYPDDDIERVIAFRRDLHEDLDGTVELEPHEIHALLEPYRDLRKVFTETLGEGRNARRDRISVAVRDFLIHVERTVPKEKAAHLREYWETQIPRAER
jgi:hypothetical protein